jgi:antitoxin component YwqK of YwqJK toxin-antitoxin module
MENKLLKMVVFKDLIIIYLFIFLRCNIVIGQNTFLEPKQYPIKQQLNYELPPILWEKALVDVKGILNSNDSLHFFHNYFLFDSVVKLPIDTNYCKQQLDIAKKKNSEEETWLPKLSLGIDLFKSIPTKELIDDGSYLMYYAPFYDINSREWIKNKVFGYFSFINQKLEGEAYFLSPFGDTLAIGNYKNGARSGLWQYILPYSIDEKRITFPTSKNLNFCYYDIEYKNGEMEGVFIYKENSIVRSKGIMKNNKPINNWETYHDNGKLSNSFYLVEEPIKLPKNIIYKYFTMPDFKLPSGTSSLYIPGFGGKVKGENIQIFSNEGKHDGEILIDKEFNAYYDDGTVLCEWVLNNGIIESGSDTIKYKNSNTIEIWELNKKRTKGTVFFYNEDYTLPYKRKIKRRDVL